MSYLVGGEALQLGALVQAAAKPAEVVNLQTSHMQSLMMRNSYSLRQPTQYHSFVTTLTSI